MTNLTACGYLKIVLEQEFPKVYYRFVSHGILHYELTNMQELCAPLLTGLDEDDRFLRCEIIGMIANYLQEE
ncbi:hypothetical protein D0C36_19215 [Mucilaginibacter conchicola]|uniref:Uncharacterized protein n=1 Tax=Mucilaginibacter conchicola TaxID=2303333 RepID=A0A372NQ64_9SPHI|nr:hypothetical protein [Mucilaginibacter conchicola]RFZ91074.1 hypothetical protein D0C36_19215 [Mucilaginibacter conchicola]